jgi:hypothetical protein
MTVTLPIFTLVQILMLVLLALELQQWTRAWPRTITGQQTGTSCIA